MQYATLNAFAIAMFVLSVTVCVLFTVEVCMTLTLTFKMVKVKYKYINRKPISDFLFVGNGNICAICHHFRDNRV